MVIKLTVKCAALGKVIRVDDVEANRDLFDDDLLYRLERAFGFRVKLVMAIPIGPKDDNHGVIKVVNSEFRCAWFTKEDEVLGRELALRLYVLVQKFLAY